MLAAVYELDEEDLTRAVASSGWSIAQLLNHLAYDDEIFWGCAIVSGEEAIGLIQDGWKVAVTSGDQAVERYRHWSRRTGAVLAEVDLNGPPHWWPSEEVFPLSSVLGRSPMRAQAPP